MFYSRTNGPKLQNTTCAFLHFQEILSFFLEMNFPKIVHLIFLWNVLSGKMFSWVMEQKAIDQLVCMIFQSAVSI